MGCEYPRVHVAAIVASPIDRSERSPWVETRTHRKRRNVPAAGASRPKQPRQPRIGLGAVRRA